MTNRGTKLKFRMTNDMMFKLVMQKNKKCLRAFVASLLGISPESITTIEVLNPIELGDAVDAKKCVLDLKIQINHKEVINLEMQVTAQDFWEERSILYLCRAYDTLESGEEYGKLQKTYHIGILDHIPDGLEDEPEFYGKYALINRKTGRLYSDKINLHMLNLRYINYAKEDEIESGLKDWALLFKASTVEELEEISNRNEGIKEAVKTMNAVSKDKKAIEFIKSREMWEHDRATEIMVKKRLNEEIEKLQGEKVKLQGEKVKLQGEKVKLQGEKVKLQGENEQIKGENEQIKGENEQLQEKNEHIEKENAQLQIQLEVYKHYKQGLTEGEIAKKMKLPVEVVSDILKN